MDWVLSHSELGAPSQTQELEMYAQYHPVSQSRLARAFRNTHGTGSKLTKEYQSPRNTFFNDAIHHDSWLVFLPLRPRLSNEWTHQRWLKDSKALGTNTVGYCWRFTWVKHGKTSAAKHPDSNSWLHSTIDACVSALSFLVDAVSSTPEDQICCCELEPKYTKIILRLPDPCRKSGYTLLNPSGCLRWNAHLKIHVPSCSRPMQVRNFNVFSMDVALSSQPSGHTSSLGKGQTWAGVDLQWFTFMNVLQLTGNAGSGRFAVHVNAPKKN